ncbi:MAG: YolD-like family protein [Brevibacillus sp.]|jgi:ribosome maturation factor RimP|nr:MAG: YolD-like family protein [Brevibacillus sp.]
MKEKRVSKKDNLFAASRFVLPEHREMYLRIKAEERRYIPPELDEEQLAAVSEQIWKAFQTGDVVSLSYYDGEAAHRLSGRVVHIDPASRQLKLKSGEKTLRIPFARLLDAELTAIS